MQKLAELCVRRPVFACVLILILLVVGTAGFFRLGVDRFPQVDLPTVSVSASLPGASPETMEVEVTDKLEEAVNTIAGIDSLTSTSSEGSSSIRVTFTLETDIDVATQDVRDRIARAQRDLPENVDPPTVRRFDPNQIPVLSIAVSGTQPIGLVTKYADVNLRDLVENAGGVGDVQLRGDRERQINIIPDAERMRAYNLSVPDLIRALQAQNSDIPGGNVEQKDQTLSLSVEGRIKSVKDFEDILLRSGGGVRLRLGDVARVEDGLADEASSSELNGQRTVQLAIYKQSGYNTLDVIQNVRARVERARETAPPGIEASIVRSQDEFIRAAVNSVEEHLLLGSVLASLVVLFFLWNWRSTLIASIAIPTSLIATFALMWILGLTLNVITLLALTLAVGIVIDDAIVVLENIYRFIDEKGMPPLQAAIEGTREIGFAVLATTLSLVAVFLPVAFMNGIVGRFLASFGLTMSFAILVSLFVSFTLTPMLTSRWLSKKSTNTTDTRPEIQSPAHDNRARQGGFYGAIDSTYVTMLKWSLTHRWVIVLLCVGALATIPVGLRALPYNFLPEEDESQLQVSLRGPQGTSLEVTRALSHKVDAALRKFPEVDYTLLNVAGSIYGGGGGDFNEANIYVHLKDVDKRALPQSEVINKMRKTLGKIGRQAKTKVRVSPINSLGLIGGGGAGRIQYILSGPNLDRLKTGADKAVAQIEKVPGVADADSSLELGQPQIKVRINRTMAGELGVDPSVLANTLRYLVGGNKVTDYVEDGRQYEVHLRAPLQDRTSIAGIAQLTVPANPDIVAPEISSGAVSAAPNAGGAQTVELGRVVSFEKTSGPASIARYNRRRQITLSANVEDDASEAEIGTAIEKIVKNLNLGSDYEVSASGSSLEQQRTNQAFLLALSLSMVFMYLILAAQFESWIHPLTILISLPLTVPFALLSLWLFGQSLNVFSLLGILVLFGVVKKNAILQVDHSNQLREQGMNRFDAIVQANRDRLRPILMTTLAFVAGMLPLVLSSGAGAGTNRAIGTVIFGGQTLSLLLTLLAVPVVYSLFDDAINWLARRRGTESEHAEIEAQI